MKKTRAYCAVSALLLGAGICITAPTAAEVNEECFLTGKIVRTANAPNTIRVDFTRMDHGDVAPCRAKWQSRGFARMQFTARPEDMLQQLNHGDSVLYHYQVNDGQRQWQRIGGQEAIARLTKYTNN